MDKSDDITALAIVEDSSIAVGAVPTLAGGSSHNIFKLDSLRYSIDGGALRDKRVVAGIKAVSFAAACGWSRSYQNALEADKWATVSEETMKIILEVLRIVEREA